MLHIFFLFSQSHKTYRSVNDVIRKDGEKRSGGKAKDFHLSSSLTLIPGRIRKKKRKRNDEEGDISLFHPPPPPSIVDPDIPEEERRKKNSSFFHIPESISLLEDLPFLGTEFLLPLICRRLGHPQAARRRLRQSPGLDELCFLPLVTFLCLFLPPPHAHIGLLYGKLYFFPRGAIRN